jgi:dihydrofolate reductase
MIAAIFAVDEGNGMGKDGNLPWPFNKEDMQWFKTLTQHQVVVMGKKSWDSSDMLKPLPKRYNVVFTNTFFDNDVEQIKGDVCESLKLLESQHPDKTIFVIGGANLLMQALPVIDIAYITRITGDYLCDVKIDLSKFLERFELTETHLFQTCKAEKYEAISRST